MNKTFKKRINKTIDKFDENGNFCGNFQPNDNTNPNSLEYDNWLLEGNLVEWSDLENLEQAKVSKIDQCKTYLINTDWQVIRLSDPTSGEPLKEGVAEKRTLARSLQVNIKACTTLEELENINIDF